MSSSNDEPEDTGHQQDKNIDNRNSNNDLVIRDGFPALRLANGQGPNVDGVEPLPRHQVWADAHTFSWTKNVLEWLCHDAALVFTARTRDDHQA